MNTGIRWRPFRLVRCQQKVGPPVGAGVKEGCLGGAPTSAPAHDSKGPNRVRFAVPARPLGVGGVLLALAIVGSSCSSPGTADSAAPKLEVEPVTTETTVGDVAEDGDTTVAPDTGEAPDGRPLPSTAEELAVELSEAENMLRTLTSNGGSSGDVAAWGRRQQALYQVMDDNRDWVDTVVAEVQPEVQDSVGRNWVAKEALAALVAGESVRDSVPAWRIVDPRPAAELIGFYKEAEEETGVGWQYLAAINLVETRMGRIEGLSTAGAVGPMQFLPSTWEECCTGDPKDPHDAIIGAAIYLVARGGPQDMAKAIRGYNNSSFYVDAVTAYAEVLAEDETAYHGYHAWQVYFRTTAGLLQLPQGYNEPEEVSAEEWLEKNPDALFGS